MTRPLHGLVVLEAVTARCSWGVRLAVAFAGRIAADLGAEVISLQSPDQTGPLNVSHDEVSALRTFLGAGKKIMTRTDDDQAPAQLRELAARANALLGDGWLRRAAGDVLGQELAHDTPRAVVQVDVQSRQYECESPSSEFTVEAESGLLDLVGDAGRAPVRLGGHQIAYSAGLAAYTGMVAALCSRDRNPGAVRVSLLESALWLNWKNLAMVSIDETPATRSGQAMTWPVVRCADGWVAVVYQPHEWVSLREMLAEPRLRDPRFDTPAGRAAHAAELSGLFEAALANLTRAEVSALAARHRLPLGAVQSVGELADDPHYRARAFVRSVGSDAGTVAMPRLPVLWGGEPFAPGRLPTPGVLEEVPA